MPIQKKMGVFFENTIHLGRTNKLKIPEDSENKLCFKKTLTMTPKIIIIVEIYSRICTQTIWKYDINLPRLIQL